MLLSIATVKRHSLPLFLLLTLTIAIYSDLPHQSFLTNWDDSLYVTDNPAAHGVSLDHLWQAVTHFYSGNYAPLQIISYMIDFELWGTWPGGYKLTNLLFHSACGFLIYLILTRHFSASRLASFCAASVFLFHPVQVESVAWISQRKTVMACFFMLFSFYSYLQNRLTDRNSWKYLSLITYSASLLAKSTTVVMLPLLLIFEKLMNGRINLRDKIPMLIATAVMVAVTLISQSPDQHGGISEYHGGTPLATLLTMLTVLPRYILMVFWPLNLSAVYAPPIRTAIDPVVVGALLLWIVMAVTGIRLMRTKPQLAFWYIFFFIGLLPVSQIVPIATIMNDRYLNIPLVGVAGCVSYLVLKIQQRVSSLQRTTFLALLLALIVPLPILTWRQVPVWRSSITLWEAASTAIPEAPEAWTGLANAYQNDNKLAGALAAYLKSIVLKPDNDISLNNIALLYLSLGKIDKAEQFAVKLLEVNKSAVAYTTLAMVYFARKDFLHAEEQVTHALIKNPKLETALTLMGSIATEQGRFELAEGYLNRSLSLHGPVAPVLYALATLHGARGEREVSARLLIRALEAGYRDVANIRDNRHLAPVVRETEMQRIISRFIPETFTEKQP